MHPIPETETTETEKAAGREYPPATTMGQAAFQAYDSARGGVNHRGEPTPAWVDLPPEIREAWETAVNSAIRGWDVRQQIGDSRAKLQHDPAIHGFTPSREVALGITKLEEAELWLQKADAIRRQTVSAESPG